MPPVIKPSSLLHLPAEKLSLGCPVLDRLLAGGLPVGSLTELAGEAGAGKTQLCLQLPLAALRLPAPAASLFIYSEPPFPLRRLRRLPLPAAHPSGDPLDHVLVAGARSAGELLALLSHADALLARPPTQLPIRLIVVDSIAALLRSEFDNNPFDLKQRSSLFFKIAAKLKEQAWRFGTAVVVTNQVVDVMSSSVEGGFGSLWSSGRRVCPALGISWANCVNTRLFLSRSDEVVESNGGGEVRTKRRMQVVFAPHLPESSCEFVITGEGVFGVDTER